MKNTGNLKKLIIVSSQYTDAIDQLWTSIQERRYSALLGPRYSGKTEIVDKILRGLNKKREYIGIKINLYDLALDRRKSYLKTLIQLITQNLSKKRGKQFEINEIENPNWPDFRAFIQATLAKQKKDLVLILDHIEAIPRDILHESLVSLRAQYMEQQSQPYHLIVLVSGALSLATQTVGKTSPFHNIVTKVTLRELNKAESNNLLDYELLNHNSKISTKARDLLLEAVQGDIFLLQELLKKCIKSGNRNDSYPINIKAVRDAIVEFTENNKDSYPPFQEAAHFIENNPDLLQSILILLEQESVLRENLPLPKSVDIDPIALTSLVKISIDNQISIRNNIYRHFLFDKFNPGYSGNLFLAHGRWEIAIFYLEKSIKMGHGQFKSNLLDTTLHAMYSAENLTHASYYLLTGLEIGFGIKKTKVWMRSQNEDRLKLAEEFGFDWQHTSQEVSIHQDSLEGRVFQEKIPLRDQVGNNIINMVFPLISPSKEIVGLISIYDFSPTNNDLEINLYGYLNRAARALSEISTRQKHNQLVHNQDLEIQRKTELLNLLYRVSTQIQTMKDISKIIQLILTSVTAHFGLRYNRAWFFVINESKTQLDGYCAIGEMNENDAYNAWGQFGNRTFDEYLEELNSTNAIKPTEIDRAIRKLHLPILSYFDDAFSLVINKQRTIRWSYASDKYGALPADFQQQFDVKDSLVTPVLTEDECVGLLVVDNKFTNTPFFPNDEELLLTLANLAAMAIIQDRRRHAEQNRLEIAETFKEISAILSSSLDIDAVLDFVLDQMGRVLPYNTASIQWLDDEAKSLRIIRAKGFIDKSTIEELSFGLDGNFPNVEVFHKKKVIRYDDIQKVYKHFSDPNYGVELVRSWLGAPLIIEGDVVGVITIDNYNLGVYTEEHELIAVTLASQAALAIQNAKSYNRQLTQKQFLNNLIQSSLDAVVAIDNKGYVTEYNERAQRICGYSKEEVIDKHMHVEVLYGTSKTPHDIQELLKHDKSLKDYETVIINKSGKKIPILLSASQIIDSNGVVVGSVGFFEDQRPKLLAKDVNEDFLSLQTKQLGKVLDSLAERIHAFIGAHSVVIYPYRSLYKAYDVSNIGTHGLLNKSKPFSKKTRTEESLTGRLLIDQQEQIIVDDINIGKDRTGSITISVPETSFLKRERVGAFMALGLWVESEPVGALFVNYRCAHNWDNEELSILKIFAAQASLIIQQARLIALQQKEHRAVEALHRLVRLSNKIKTDIAWDATLKEGINVTNAQKGRILVWDNSAEDFVSKYQRGFKVSEDNCLENHGNGSCNFLRSIASKKDPVLIVDTELSPLPECCQNACGGIRSLLALPIVGIKGKPMGILLLADEEPVAFDENDEKIMKSIVSSVGITIENIVNYQAVQDNNRLLEGLLRVFHDVTTHQDLPMVLKKITDGTLHAMHCDIVTLYTFDDAKGQFAANPTITGELNFPEAPNALGYVSKDSVVWKVFEQGKAFYNDNALSDSILNNPSIKRVGRIESFVIREKVLSSAAFPLKIHNQVVGILFANYRTRHHFSRNEINALQIFANEAAVAINETQLNSQIKQKSAHLEAVYEASKIVTASMDRRVILDSILEQVVEKVVPVHGKKAIAGSLQVFDEESKELVMESVYPPTEYDGVVSKIDKRLSVLRMPGRRFGITARAASELKPQNVGNVRLDPDYILYSDATKSELAFPLLDGERLHGVLDIECDEENAFDNADIDAISALAELSIVALRNAEQAKEMMRINSVASMGAWGAELTHEMKNELANIRRKTYNIDRLLSKMRTNSLRKEIKESIQEIEQSVDNLKLPPMPRNYKDSEQFMPAKPACPDVLISKICNDFRAKTPDIHIIENLDCNNVFIRLHELWFERILQHLLRNATTAVSKKSNPQIVVRSTRAENNIRVEIEDNGTGISKDIDSILFQQPTPEGNEKSGHGLLIVRFLLEKHGGRIGVLWNKPGFGVCFFFVVPVI